MDTTEVLALKIDQVSDVQDEIKRDIDKLVETATDTKERMILMEAWSLDHEERDAGIQKHLTKLAETVEPIALDYKIRLKRKAWTDKIIWLMLSFAVIWHLKGIFV